MQPPRVSSTEVSRRKGSLPFPLGIESIDGHSLVSTKNQEPSWPSAWAVSAPLWAQESHADPHSRQHTFRGLTREHRNLTALEFPLYIGLGKDWDFHVSLLGLETSGIQVLMGKRPHLYPQAGGLGWGRQTSL